tara:strand:+ start:286 stop:795 length:510 start_codon:yes stop_codon:yes gene_type:complete
MKVFKFICLCFVTLVYAQPVVASDFKYAATFTCGPKKLEGLGNFKNLGDRFWYYFFNIAANGDFVVLNDDIQYKSFEQTKTIQLFHQNGGTFTVSSETVLGNDIYKFKDVSRNPVWIKTLIIDREAKTYISRVSVGEENFKPNVGICFNYKKHGSEPQPRVPILEIIEL